jgi:hypothetical protein
VTNAYTYQLRVSALVETIKSLHTTMTLRAQLPPLSGFSQEVSFAEVVFKAGELLTCAITTTEGRKRAFSSQEAFALVEGLGVLEWRHVSQPGRHPPGGVQSSPFPEQVKVPGGATGRGIPYKRVSSPSAAQVQALPHRQKQVFLLIDGHKDCQQIGQVLALPPERVMSVLDALHHLQLIGFKAENEPREREGI